MKVTITLEDDLQMPGAVNMEIGHDRKATAEELNQSMAARAALGFEMWIKSHGLALDTPMDRDLK